MIIKNSMDPPELDRYKKGGSVEFLHFHVYNSVHPITYYLPTYRDEPNPEYEP